MSRIVVVLALVAGLLLPLGASPAGPSAYPRPANWQPADLVAPLYFPDLDAFASKFAMRKVSVECTTYLLEAWLSGAWGVVIPDPTLGKAQKTMVEYDPICTGPLALNDPDYPDWKKAIGVLVIIHESYHLRHWSWASDEGRVECRAIRHFKVGVRLLGGSEELVEELYPVAYWAHQAVTSLTDAWGKRPYWDPRCKVEAPW